VDNEPHDMTPPSAVKPTAGRDYSDRLVRLSTARWKKLLDVQRPYRWNLRRLELGRCLDVGCGTGRNLANLGAGAVGVDHNPYSVAEAVALGCSAYTPEQFFADPALSAEGSYDSLLAAHLVEHLTPDEASGVVSGYLPLVAPGGRCVFITPQERGYASDLTHVTFTDFSALEQLADRLGLVTERRYSFPFPRPAGRFFTYNEFVLVARKPASGSRNSAP